MSTQRQKCSGEEYAKMYQKSCLPQIKGAIKDVSEYADVLRTVGNNNSYFPGVGVANYKLFHEFGHAVDFIIRGIDWRVSKPDFGFTSVNEKDNDGFIRFVRSEARAMWAERLVMDRAGLQHVSAFTETNEVIFWSYELGKMQELLVRGENEHPYDYFRKLYPELNEKSVDSAFVEFVDIFNSL